ncbi:MAG: dihydroneopterin aldolase [Pseudomonadota bacterium]
MTSEIALAFDHPEARARATEGDVIPDRISLRDYVTSADIGAYQQERGKRQRLCFNVVVEVNPVTGIEDDVDKVVSYDRITEAIEAELAGERLNLLETLAENVAARILLAPLARRTFVRIEKLDLGPGALGVEIVRTREALPIDATEDAPEPWVILLGNAAIASPHLTGWLDQITASGHPAILCVGPPEQTVEDVGHTFVQRRMDLLDIEQNAWRLAALDDRCVVRATRSELDWAAKKRNISVWAPSKMVLDAATPPKGLTAADLTQWLAREVSASRILAIGLTVDGAETQSADSPTLA